MEETGHRENCENVKGGVFSVGLESERLTVVRCRVFFLKH